LLVPPKDVGALEQAIRKILGDKKLSGRMGSKAREYVLLKADSNYCLKTLESFYISVVESKEGSVWLQKILKCRQYEHFGYQSSSR
jgi:glycosyltransferase involved in cell wall biosynthesis